MHFHIITSLGQKMKKDAAERFEWTSFTGSILPLHFTGNYFTPGSVVEN